MKSYIILFYFVNAICISITSAEVCRATTTVSPYFRYEKCYSTDKFYECPNCDEFEPSCSSDSDCGNGVCCNIHCSSEFEISCRQCQSI